MNFLRRDPPLVPPSIVFATSSASIVIETTMGFVPIQSSRTGAKIVIAEGRQHQYILMLGTIDFEDPLYSLDIDSVDLQSAFDVDRLSVKIIYVLPAVKTRHSLQLPRVLNFCITFNNPLIFLSFRYYISSRSLPRRLHPAGDEGEELLDFFVGCRGIEHPPYMTASPSMVLPFIVGFVLASAMMSLLFTSSRA